MLKKITILCIALLNILLFFACGTHNRDFNLRPAKGDINYGGTFRYNETEFIRSLFPQNITEVTGHRCANQVYEGLVELDQKDLSIHPAIAKSWEISDDGLVYTFHLNKGVYYHDDPCFQGGIGREVKAQDFKYCFDKLCTTYDLNKGFWVFENRVKGANAYHELDLAKKTLPAEGVTGVRVINDSTLQIELVQPFAAFLYILATPFTFVFPKEAYDKYGSEMRMKCVGTGPFYIKAIEENETIILLRNKKYWRNDSLGNQLPYLDGVRISFIHEAQAELLEFKRGNLDQVYRPALEMMDEIYDDQGNLTQAYAHFQSQHMPSMSFQYYGMLNLKNRLFDNIKLRQALCYAIDREKICRFTLKGTGFPASYGVVPPGIAGYNSAAVHGYTFDPIKAKQLLAEAGYPDGKGFGELTLQINAGGGRNQQVAETIVKMLRDNLNLNVKITQLQWAQHLENAETSKCDFWRFGWQADYPDPENFLNLFYGPHVPPKPEDNSYINTSRFKNAEFDEKFKQALRTIDDVQRNIYYHQADSIVTAYAPVLPIYYDVEYRLLQKYIENYPKNAMEYRSFREVWMKK